MPHDRRHGGFELKGGGVPGLSGEECRDRGCPVFGVESGGPVIGLGLLMILFGLIPAAIEGIRIPLPIALLFIGFGVFLTWAGLTR